MELDESVFNEAISGGTANVAAVLAEHFRYAVGSSQPET
jgi:hypothetical protein